MRPKKKYTIQDIAKALNTTPSTVSRALQDHPRIGAEMRERVKKFAREHDYQPDFRASSLRKGSGRTIGVLVPQVDINFFAKVLRGIDAVASEADYSVLICQSIDSLKKEMQLVKGLLYGKVDGLVASVSIETSDDEHFRNLAARGLPLVFFDKVIESMNVSKVVIDDHRGAYISVEHLISQGCKRIAFFAGPDYLNIHRNRAQGYRDAIRDHGFEMNEDLVFQDATEEKGGYRAMKKLLQLDPMPDGLVCCTDYAALGAIVCAREHGIKIPEQIALSGFANEPFDSLISPSLTSVEQSPNEMGQKAATLLIDQMENKALGYVPRTITLEPSLIVRESSQKLKVNETLVPDLQQ
jgi:LacI family transcriptional regulator